MKIGITRIVYDHLGTLKDDRTGKKSVTDVLIFFVAPLILGTAGGLFGFSATIEVYNLSVTFFGIFVALLLNLQVATFGIFQRKWQNPGDPTSAAIQEKDLKTRTNLLEEINCNVSYLILVSSLAIAVFLIFFATKSVSLFFSGITVVIYSHFVLTLLMIIKRSHALFQREYKK